ncbi:MAG: YbjN domain-containing protein [Scytonematopsis contorta HA4267-MV1]|jgi:hypothetical protein|nr:YbjN domain-containing protein [Scytonematopsis contorta HA4267-MV1]
MTDNTQNYQLETELTLRDSDYSGLTIHAISLILAKLNDTINSCCLIFQVTPELYHHIDTDALFNLKPELRSAPTNGEFDPSTNIEITASLKPELLPHLTPHLNDIQTYLKNLSQEQPDNPLLLTENWYALQVKQQREGTETGYRTFWDYLSPSLLNAEKIDSEKINSAIFNFFKDWADDNLSTMGTQAISQALGEVANSFEEWVDTSLSSISEETISQILEPMVKAFEELADATYENVDSKFTISNTSILQAIINFFTQDDWSFTKIKGEPVLQLLFQGQNAQWTCYAKAREEQQQFVFYSICPVIVPETKRVAIAEFITRANSGMIIGNFELDFTDGEICYKTSVDVEGSTLTFPLIKRLVYANVMVMDEYLPGILSVINDDTFPIDAIAKIENRQPAV